jgi:hypothetical protein
MRAYWILPNRNQSDAILASDGHDILPLRQILDPKLRPDGFSHGVPTELLEKCGPKAREEILFAQRFPGWNEDKTIFCLSSPAGIDSSGRAVHLGLLFILEPGERPQFELPSTGLSKEDRVHASGLIRRMASSRRDDIWAQSVHDLIEFRSDREPATNVALKRSVVHFHPLYAVGPGGSLKKLHWRRPHTTAIALLIFLAVLGVCLSVRACEQSSRPAVHLGVATWHFS